MLQEWITDSHLKAMLVLDHYLSPYDSKRRIFRRRVKYTQKFLESAPRPAVSAANLPEVDAKDITPERFIELSKNFTHPMVVRGFLRNATSTRTWGAEHFINVCANDRY